MQYYTVIYENLYNEMLEQFVIKNDEENGIFLLSFKEKDIEFIYRSFSVEPKNFSYIDTKGNKYAYLDSKTKLVGKCGFSPEKMYKNFVKLWKKVNKEEKLVTAYLNKTEKSTIINTGINLFGFKSYRNIDKNNNISFPFRFRKAKGHSKQPLIIYFSGAGALGTDNVKPFCEFVPQLIKLKKTNCNILIPQTINKTNQGKSYEDFNCGLNRYVTSVKELIEKFAPNNNIDMSRIYIVGTSFGGFCAWRSAYLFPSFCRAMVCVMGGYNVETDDEKYNDFSKFTSLSIWTAHSSNDTIVSARYDDLSVEQLKKLGADIKYTRWNKYGHKMASTFYRKEPWVDWLFSKS